MHADSKLAVELVQALLENAGDLAADARLLLEHDRFARCYALSALAGEELGKIAICLDWLFGESSSSLKETRKAWQSHGDKLASLASYRAAFIEEPGTIKPEILRADAKRLASRKMDALYVDFREGLVRVPAEVAPRDAIDLLGQVEEAIAHATKHLAPLSNEVARAIEEFAPQLVAPLSTYLDSLSPQEAVVALRRFLASAQKLTDHEWADALRSNQVLELLSNARAVLGPPKPECTQSFRDRSSRHSVRRTARPSMPFKRPSLPALEFCWTSSRTITIITP